MSETPEKTPRGYKKPSTRISASQVIKVLFLVLALTVAFLFALNGRYVMIDKYCYLDKWKKEVRSVDELIK